MNGLRQFFFGDAHFARPRDIGLHSRLTAEGERHTDVDELFGFGA